MGVAIGSLIKECREKVDLTTLKNKKIGFDAYNMLYQFVTTIRGGDGQPLKNSSGEITSHINGLFYRTTNIMKYGIKPIFVFDGKSNALKDKTKQNRRDIRTKARDKYDIAVKSGNLEDVNKYGRQSATINTQIINESKEFLEALGVDYINAPGEAEAQISYMTNNGSLDYASTQDYDTILFGSPNLLRNLNVSGKRKVIGKNIYVDVYPYLLESKCVFETLNINREKLIWLSILIGTDFNEKVKGVGPKTALKLVKNNNSFEDIEKELLSKNKTIDFDYKQIENIFLKPNINTTPEIIKNKFDRDKLENLLLNKYDFSKDRIDNYLTNFINKKDEVEKQKTISKWF